MSGWSSNGRTALFKALGAACDQIDADVAKELCDREIRESKLLQELEEARIQASRVSSLEIENSMLKETIEKVQKSKSPEASSTTIIKEAEDGVHTSPQKATAFEEDLGKLREKYSRLRSLYDQSLSLLKRRKDEVHKWIEYAESLEAKIKKLQAESERIASKTSDVMHSKISDNRSRLDQDEDEHLRLPDYTGRPPVNSSFISDPSTSFGPQRSADVHVPPRRALSQPPGSEMSDRTDSLPATSQTETQNPEENAEELPKLPSMANTAKVRVKEEPSSDPPVIISERAVRKRRNNSPSYYTGAPKRRFKREDGESPPMITEESAYFDPEESMDLDEGQNDLRTPRKRRLLEEHFAANNREFMGSASPGHVSTFSRARPTPQLPTAATILQPISPNRRITKSTARKGKETRKHSLNKGVRLLAEDGYSSDAQGSDPSTPQTNAGRLDALLNSTGSRPSTVISRPLNRQSRDLSSKRELDLPPRRTLPFPDKDKPETPQSFLSTKTRTPLATLAQPISAIRSAPPPRRNNETRGPTASLRQKPLSSMKLDDFKINPKYNNGQNYAFAEVVRNRAEREGLPGCTDMNCCGKYFRAMAASERSGKEPSFLRTQETAILLENYLGEDAFLLGSMTREEKEELWLAARTRELANKYGKHRHRHHRRPSPPGFWNADFPSTQEEARDRQEGLKMEQALVQERYREAMRQDGRWLFRDE